MSYALTDGEWKKHPKGELLADGDVLYGSRSGSGRFPRRPVAGPTPPLLIGSVGGDRDSLISSIHLSLVPTSKYLP